MDDQSLPGDAPRSITRSRPDALLCCGCAYDLAGIDRSGACPECGLAIQETLRFGLVGQPIEVLNRLRSGVIWIFAGIGAQFVAGILSSIFSAVGITLLAQNSMGQGIAVAIVGMLFVVAAQTVSLIGYWRYSTPLAGPKLDGWKYGKFRRTLRITSVILIAFSMFNSPLPMIAFAGGGAANPAAAAAQTAAPSAAAIIGLGVTAGVSLLLGLSELIRYLTTAAYTSALAARLPNPKLARLSAFIYKGTAWVIIGVIGLVCVFVVASAVSGTVGSGMGLGMILSGIGMILIALFAFGLWIAWIVMLAQFLAAISKVRKRAMAEAAQ